MIDFPRRRAFAFHQFHLLHGLFYDTTAPLARPSSICRSHKSTSQTLVLFLQKMAKRGRQGYTLFYPNVAQADIGRLLE